MFTCSLQCLHIYDVEQKFTLIKKFGEKDGYDQWIYVLSVSWDNRYLASGDHLGRVRLNKIGNNFQKIKSLHHHNLWVTSLVFSKKNNHLVTGSADMSIFIYSINNHFSMCFNILFCHQDVVRTIIYSKDEKYLLSASYDKSLAIYNVENNYQPKAVLKNFHDDKIREIKFS